jgi:hypothetical protein
MEFPLQILSDALHDPELSIFKGPILNLIKNGYIDYDPHFKK